MAAEPIAALQYQMRKARLLLPVVPRQTPIMWRFLECREGQSKRQGRLSLRSMEKDCGAWVETGERIQNLQLCRKVGRQVRQPMLRL